MFEKVCFFVNYNQYESKRYFTEKLSQAMNRQGIKTKIFDVVESKIHERMIEEIKEMNELIIKFISSPIELKEIELHLIHQ